MLEKYVDFSELAGKTLTSVTGAEKGSEKITFVTTTGEVYEMYHDQNCCESVDVEDIVGDVSDLIGHPLQIAAESTSAEDDFVDPDPEKTGSAESCTWTFYKLATIKGYVDIRWFGQSNGYYSESVSFVLTKAGNENDN